MVLKRYNNHKNTKSTISKVQVKVFIGLCFAEK